MEAAGRAKVLVSKCPPYMPACDTGQGAYESFACVPCVWWNHRGLDYEPGRLHSRHKPGQRTPVPGDKNWFTSGTDRFDDGQENRRCVSSSRLRQAAIGLVSSFVFPSCPSCRRLPQGARAAGKARGSYRGTRAPARWPLARAAGLSPASPPPSFSLRGRPASRAAGIEYSKYTCLNRCYRKIITA